LDRDGIADVVLFAWGEVEQAVGACECAERSGSSVGWLGGGCGSVGPVGFSQRDGRYRSMLAGAMSTARRAWRVGR
jgi:hypothetical protein